MDYARVAVAIRRSFQPINQEFSMAAAADDMPLVIGREVIP